MIAAKYWIIIPCFGVYGNHYSSELRQHIYIFIIKDPNKDTILYFNEKILPKLPCFRKYD